MKRKNSERSRENNKKEILPKKKLGQRGRKSHEIYSEKGRDRQRGEREVEREIYIYI